MIRVRKLRTFSRFCGLPPHSRSAAKDDDDAPMYGFGVEPLPSEAVSVYVAGLCWCRQRSRVNADVIWYGDDLTFDGVDHKPDVDITHPTWPWGVMSPTRAEEMPRALVGDQVAREVDGAQRQRAPQHALQLR